MEGCNGGAIVRHRTELSSRPRPRRLGRELVDLAHYVRAFGAGRAAALFAKIHLRELLAGFGAAPYPVPIPGTSMRAWLRPGTTDREVWDQTFARRIYALDRLPQSDSLRARYDAMRSAEKVPLVVDCGANIGLSAIWWQMAFPDAQVVAVEPDDANFEVLDRNTADWPGIVIVNAGVWDRAAMLRIVNPCADAWAYRIEEGDEGLPALTVPTLMERFGGEPLLIKINIEGAEAALFRSNTEWLDRFPLAIVELHDCMIPGCGAGDAFFRAVSRAGRDYILRGQSVFAFLRE
jgi:FkbM family methyltransferase